MDELKVYNVTYRSRNDSRVKHIIARARKAYQAIWQARWLIHKTMENHLEWEFESLEEIDPNEVEAQVINNHVEAYLDAGTYEEAKR